MKLKPILVIFLGLGFGFFVTSSAMAATNGTDFTICQNVADPRCKTCEASKGVWTALGCIHYNPQIFVSDFLRISLGVAGGIALLLMAYGAFLLSVSQGDPKKAQEGKDMIANTIAGLLFIIFAVVILKFIGVDILSLPGF